MFLIKIQIVYLKPKIEFYRLFIIKSRLEKTCVWKLTGDGHMNEHHLDFSYKMLKMLFVFYFLGIDKKNM
jgi:hypothetical protein